MFELVFTFALGFGTCVLVAPRMLRQHPKMARRLGFLPQGGYDESVELDGHGPPAVDPGALPDTVTAEEVEQGRVQELPDPELERILRLLPQWRPKRHQDEYGFHDSFERFLVKQGGYDYSEFKREQRISWSPGEEGTPRTNHARPDFIIRDRVLIEIKRNLTGSGQSDRSLGQMLRYLVAWRSRGPALLLVCNDFDNNLRALIARHVRSWKSQGVPILAYFVRSPEQEPE